MKNTILIVSGTLTNILLVAGLSQLAERFDPLASMSRKNTKKPIPVSWVCIPCDIDKSVKC
jgi:hypothetical protein